MERKELEQKLREYRATQKKIESLKLSGKDTRLLETELQILDNTLEVLKDKERAVVSFRYIENMKWNQVAVMSGYSDSRCRALGHKGLDTMLEVLGLW